MHKNYIPISEIFYSIQGEGINLGKPAVFIRVYFCNLYVNGAIPNILG